MSLSQLATLCYLRAEQQTLMLYRNQKSDDFHLGKWNGLGGKVESGESPEESVIREVKEESGLTVQNPKLCGILTFPGFKSDGVDWVVFVFEAIHFTGELSSGPEGTLHWIEDSRILDLNLWPGDLVFLPWIYKGGPFFSAKLIYENRHFREHQVHFYQ